MQPTTQTFLSEGHTFDWPSSKSMQIKAFTLRLTLKVTMHTLTNKMKKIIKFDD
jgi:hypothetical protein